MKKLIIILAILVLALPVVVSGQAERTVRGRVDQAEDTAHVTGDFLSMCGVVRNDALAALCGTDGDNCILQVDADGALYVTTAGGAGPTGYVEDVAETDAAVMAMCGTVRRDAAASSAGTTGDNATFNTDATGQLWVVDAATGALLGTIDTDTGAMVVDLAAIEVLITAGNVDLAAIEVNQDALVVDVAALEVDLAAMEVLSTAANVDLAAIEVTQDALVVDAAAIEVLLGTMDADTSALFGTVAGSEQQVDVITTAQAAPVGSIVCGQTDVPAAGTSVNLASNACATGVTIGCELVSTGDCYVGHATGDNRANGMSLPDGGPNVFLPISNTNLLWVDVTTAGDDLGWCCF